MNIYFVSGWGGSVDGFGIVVSARSEEHAIQEAARILGTTYLAIREAKHVDLDEPVDIHVMVPLHYKTKKPMHDSINEDHIRSLVANHGWDLKRIWFCEAQEITVGSPFKKVIW